MLIYLDTNFLIEAQKAGTPSNRKFGAFLENGDTFEVSAIVWAEFLCGPLQLGEEDNARIIVGARNPVTEHQAELAAKMFDQTGRRSRSLADCIIAAGAILAGIPLATENMSDFQRFVPFGLVLV